MPDLPTFLASALGVPLTHPDVALCAAKCEAELVRTYDSLVETWDETKTALPALARHRIGIALRKKPLPSPPPSPPELEPGDLEETPVAPPIDPYHWVRGFLACVLLLAGPVVLGFMTWKETDTYERTFGLPPSPPSTIEGQYNINLWWYAYIPLMVVAIVEIGLASTLAPRIGWDMIEQASEDADLREAMKNSMTTQGFVAALFLTVVWGMLQAGAIQGDSSLIISQWYVGLLVTSIALTMVGTVASIICLLYIEPLNSKAALQCVYDNFMYFGEPLALSIFGFINSLWATIIWLFGEYGLGAGIVASVVIGYSILRSVVIYQYLSDWVNLDIAAAEKALRQKRKKALATTGLKADTNSKGKVGPYPP